MILHVRHWLLILALLIPTLGRAEITEQGPLDSLAGAQEDESKSVDQLIEEAQQLFATRQPIDGRAKLQRALQKAPQDFRPHMLLGGYYLGEVGHFQLAYRYLRTAEMLFEKQYGSDRNNTLKPEGYKQHARLLFLLSESRLNLDDYQGALDTLDRYGKLYWDDWYPGSKAWVLMKLRRVDDAIRTAQAGVIQGAEPTRTYNILGILLSLKNNRELALQAFARAIRSEFALGGSGQVATPLNNAGEVYNELFQDRLAETAWLQALQMPDGCEHILPSLNLAVMYTNEARLFQAERILSDFESCYAARSLRQDTEHRALLALGKGRIALHEGDVELALNYLAQATERQQWFGKIGTDPDDLKLAAALSMAAALKAEAAALHDRAPRSMKERVSDALKREWILVRAWWMTRRGREISLDQLEAFEDLSIRNTDAMLEYPTLGRALEDLPEVSVRQRLDRLAKEDQRKQSAFYYALYRGTNLLAQGDAESARKQFILALSGFRNFERLARAEALALLVRTYLQDVGLFRRESVESRSERFARTEELFELLPSRLRFHDLALPLREITVVGQSSDLAELQQLFDNPRFELAPAELRARARYRVVIDSAASDRANITLWDTTLNQTVASVSGAVQDAAARAELFNEFISKTFQHRVDPAGEPLVKSDLLEGILGTRDRAVDEP